MQEIWGRRKIEVVSDPHTDRTVLIGIAMNQHPAALRLDRSADPKFELPVGRDGFVIPAGCAKRRPEVDDDAAGRRKRTVDDEAKRLLPTVLAQQDHAPAERITKL